MLVVFSSLLQSVSIILAAISFIYGINAWRRAFLGQRRVDLAEETLELFGRARDALSEIRSPFGFGGEGSSRHREESESAVESRVLDQAYVVIERYNKHSELFSRLFSLQYRFAIYFGSDEIKPFIELQSILSEVILSSKRLSRYWLDDLRGNVNAKRRGDHDRRIEKAESIFWEGEPETDLIWHRINKAFAQVENVCRNSIEPEPNFWRSLKRLGQSSKRYFSYSG